MPLKPSNRFSVSPAVMMRLTVLSLLLAGLAGAQCSSTGEHWWNSHWFWAAVAVLIAATIVVVGRTSERAHFLRERALESAIRERIADLDRETRREMERSQILEMLVSKEPLDTVLDALLRSIRLQCPDALCAIVLKRDDGCQVLASLDLPGDWLSALRAPYAVPFEVWRMPMLNWHPASDPAWRLFASELESAGPGIVHSRPVRNAEGQPAAILFFYAAERELRDSDERVAEYGERMARLAIEQSRLYESLHFQAHHDGLTGLPNRALFEERLERSMRDAELLGQRLAVLFVDLDRFKRVNDSFSHRIGDLFLREIAGRLTKTLRPGDMVARIGGDEFTIVISDLKYVAEAAEIADHILEAIRQPVFLDGKKILASASAGIAIFPDDGRDAEMLERAADAAMYCAKDLGRNRIQTFSTRNETLDRARMDEELRIALREGYFIVYYQPKVGVDRKSAGFEALVRMNHPIHGQIPPVSFIPVAESNGLIVPLGAWVLEEVCRQIAVWESRGFHAVPVAVNVSPVQICLPDFAKTVDECLQRHGIAASRLELELTESLLINAEGVAQEQLLALRALGVHLSIDDFGTGFSSLSYLHRLQVDAIKLDKSFVQSIDTDHLAHSLVEAMIGVAKLLGLSVIAEGVETESQRDALLEAGCSLMQGFLFARPQPADQVEKFLRTRDCPDLRQVVSEGLPQITENIPDNHDDLARLAASMQFSRGVAMESIHL